jgi:hypothetical protein
MQFFILVLLFCFSVFLFSLYRLSQDDFLFIRKGITLDNIFNAAFFTAFVSLVSSRAFYIISHPAKIFSTFLGAVLFPYFPGLSIVGAVFGGVLFLIAYCLYKKIVVGRMLDFFSISFLFALPWSLIFIYFVSKRPIDVLASFGFYLAYLLIVIFILIRLFISGKIKDGGVGLIFLTVFSFFTLSLDIINAKFNFIFNLENLILLFGLMLSLALFIYRQMIVKKSY